MSQHFDEYAHVHINEQIDNTVHFQRIRLRLIQKWIKL